jgi:hypothetical protein
VPLPDPDTKPREFLTVLVAAGLLIFRPTINGPSDAFDMADRFVTEAEKRVGKLNP